MYLMCEHAHTIGVDLFEQQTKGEGERGRRKKETMRTTPRVCTVHITPHALTSLYLSNS